MKRLTNPFGALSLVGDDEDLSPAVTMKSSKTGKSSLSESTVKYTRGESKGDNAQALFKPLIWIDLEMTGEVDGVVKNFLVDTWKLRTNTLYGLDVQRDRILEIACIITDGKLEKFYEGPDLIINHPEDTLASMNDWCQEHHTASGLVEAVRKSTITEQEAEDEVLEFVNQYVVSGRGQIAGNSVYVDLKFIQKYMPKLAECFSHVVVDVSSVRALCKRWYPHDYENAPEKKKSHRALEDIKESIAELKYMQTTIFKRSKK